jgi:hypothetical protein
MAHRRQTKITFCPGIHVTCAHRRTSARSSAFRKRVQRLLQTLASACISKPSLFRPCYSLHPFSLPPSFPLSRPPSFFLFLKPLEPSTMPRPAPSAPVQRVGGGARAPARVPGPRGGAQPIVASGACSRVIMLPSHECNHRRHLLQLCSAHACAPFSCWLPPIAFFVVVSPCFCLLFMPLSCLP